MCAAAAGGARSVTIRRGARLSVVAARAPARPPKVDLTGPGGVRITTPDGPEGVDTRRAILVQDPATRTTSIALVRPAPGRWTVTPRAGSALSRVRIADQLPPVRVKAKVTGRRTRRVLTWDARGLPRHHLTFVERAPGGAARVLVRGTRTRGKRFFSPLSVRGRHRIEVTVARKGVPRKRLVVARFSVAPTKLTRVTGLKRKGRTVSWRRQGAAASYAVSVARNGVVIKNTTTRRTRVTVPAGPVTVIVVAIGTDGRFGPAVRKRLR